MKRNHILPLLGFMFLSVLTFKLMMNEHDLKHLWSTYTATYQQDQTHQDEIKELRMKVAQLSAQHREDQNTIVDLRVKVAVADQMQRGIVKPTNGKVVKLAVTAYTDTIAGGCRLNHAKTAALERVVPGKTIAVSRDLGKKYMHRRVWISGIGYRTINDLSSKSLRRSVDLAVNTVADAHRFGRKELEVVLLE